MHDIDEERLRIRSLVSYMVLVDIIGNYLRSDEFKYSITNTGADCI